MKNQFNISSSVLSASLLLLVTSLLVPVANGQERQVIYGPSAGSEVAQWQGRWLFASEQQGLVLEDKQQLKVVMPGQFEYLSVHDNIALTYDSQVDQVQGIRLGLSNMQRLALLPKRSFQVEWLCLQSRRADQNLYAWIGDDAGQAEQWLLTSKQKWQPRLVRSLSISMGALKCAVSMDEDLYIIDNAQGLWRYPAAPHAPSESTLVTSLPDNHLSGLAIHANQLFMLDETGNVFNQHGQKRFSAFEGLEALESLYLTDKHIMAYSDDEDRFYQAPRTESHKSEVPAQALIKEVATEVESQIADRAGDTMDDPAIWIHPSDPSKSRVLGTNKRWGLLSFSMEGEQLQAIGAGRVNNVDIRQGVSLGGKKRDIAVASNRDRNSLSVFEFNVQGELTQLVEQATSLTDIYGLCLYQPSKDELYAFVNNKAGTISQLALQWKGEYLKATEVRQLQVPSQPEGCVADDNQQRLFVGEENEGIWVYDLSGDESGKYPKLQGEMIIKAGGPLVADIEGISLYKADNQEGYLVVSSQGNDSYLLYDSEPPYAYVDRFRIGINADKGHDGSAETDGLDVTSSAVGTGVWAQGMMVVQDGRNRMPDENQNFKWVPWSAITSALDL